MTVDAEIECSQGPLVDKYNYFHYRRFFIGISVQLAHNLILVII